MRIDLHTHSSTSDGTDTPEEVARLAAVAGLDVVALTDHDTFAGLPAAVEAGERHGVRVVEGIELSCRREGKSVHLLGYGLRVDDPALNDELAKVRDGRDNRLAVMLERLSELGMPLEESEVLEFVGDAPSIGRPHVADAMVRRGYVRGRNEAFAAWLGDDKPAFVDRYACDLVAGIKLIHGAGGAAVIAHPWGRGSRSVLDAEVLAELVREHGLDGLEIGHTDHGPAGSGVRGELTAIARSLGVLVTGSSDYHGTGKPDNPLGCNLTDPVMLDRLEQAISRHGAENRG